MGTKKNKAFAYRFYRPFTQQCTEENNHFLSAADAVFRMWQFRNYEFGIGENVPWITHVLTPQFFLFKK